jgi:hypothetical protein
LSHEVVAIQESPFPHTMASATAALTDQRLDCKAKIEPNQKVANSEGQQNVARGLVEEH